jgi:hypothetical protein
VPPSLSNAEEIDSYFYGFLASLSPKFGGVRPSAAAPWGCLMKNLLESNKYMAPLAPGVWLARGGTHNSLVIEMGDHLVIFEPPLFEGCARRG